MIKARKDGEKPAQADFNLQVANAMIQFDYDYREAPGDFIDVAQLLVWDEDLDYAILSLKKAPGRNPLPIRPDIIPNDPLAPTQVNLIQHPNGSPKQIGIRNNSIYQSQTSLLLYFTDTLEGSSGAPVFDDFWKVVALHRGFQSIENFQFEGNPVTRANYGTHIRRVLESVKAKHKGAWDAILACQPQLKGLV